MSGALTPLEMNPKGTQDLWSYAKLGGIAAAQEPQNLRLKKALEWQLTSESIDSFTMEASYVRSASDKHVFKSVTAVGYELKPLAIKPES